MADVMAQDYETRVSPLVDIRIGSKSHSSEGFAIQTLVSNYGSMPVNLDRLEFDWWLSDQATNVRSKTVPLGKTLPPHSKDEKFSIRLTDSEARNGRSDLADLRALYRLLHGRAKVFFYSGPLVYSGNVPTGMHQRETPPFQLIPP
jgi:hypothetical protein